MKINACLYISPTNSFLCLDQQTVLQIDSMNLANSEQSRWADPDFRVWQGSSGNIHQFNWKG